MFDEAACLAETNLILVRRHLHALGREAITERVFDIDVAHCRHSFDDSQRANIAAGLDQFFAENERRIDRLARWRTALKYLTTELLAPVVPTPTPWRAVFRFEHPHLRDAVVRALRKNGFDAGTNYPPLTDFLPNLLQGEAHADADKWGRSVLTLWLDRTYDNERIAKAAAVIERIIEEEGRTSARNASLRM